MDAARARLLADKVLPGGAGLAHDRAADIGLSQAQIRAIDSSPDDGVLTVEELVDAFRKDRVDADEHTGKITKVKAEFSFVDDPAAPGPRRDLFPGYSALGVRNPVAQPLTGAKPASYTPPAGMSLADLTKTVTTPEKVTQLLQPFGSAIYDKDRAANNTGPNGTQSPEFTHSKRSGICRDSHQLGAYVLRENGYNARQTGYKSEGVLHAVLTYEGRNKEGFGLIEYGTHYSPEQIAQILGRPALSHEEAMLAVRPEAKLINLYSSPEANQEGYVESLYYTMGHMLYQDTLKLKHENSAEWDRNGGAKIELALSQNWGVKVQYDTGQSPDPTARHAASVAVGYQAGNEDHWMRLSTGLQYRPNEGHHSVGPNVWEKHPALVLGAHAEGQVTPFKLDLGENHRTRTTLGGDFTGALALTRSAGTDAANGTTDGKLRVNDGLTNGLGHATVRLGQHLEGRLSEHFGYRSELFLAPDILAMTLGYSDGGKGLYSNSGANASLHFNKGAFGAHLGAQYLFTQVNNLEATGASTGVSFGTGPVSLRADSALLSSPEGWRMQTKQSVNLRLGKDVDAYGFAGQERIFNEKYGNFKVESGTNFGFGLRARF